MNILSADVLQSPGLVRIRGVRHGFFTRRGGVSEGIYASLNTGLASQDVREHIFENRARVAEFLGAAPENLVNCYQIHSARAVYVEKPWGLEEMRADALVTDTPGLCIAALSADCAPVLLADPAKKIIGAAHAGWRGALAGIVESTVAEMEKRGAKRENIVAAIGPCIGKNSYEIGEDFFEQFMNSSELNNCYFEVNEKSCNRHFDLAGYVRGRLEEAGIATVWVSGEDTYADPERYYSARRMLHAGEAGYGRLISAIVLEESL